MGSVIFMLNLGMQSLVGNAIFAVLFYEDGNVSYQGLVLEASGEKHGLGTLFSRNGQIEVRRKSFFIDKLN